MAGEIRYRGGNTPRPNIQDKAGGRDAEARRKAGEQLEGESARGGQKRKRRTAQTERYRETGEVIEELATGGRDLFRRANTKQNPTRRNIWNREEEGTQTKKKEQTAEIRNNRRQGEQTTKRKISRKRRKKEAHTQK